MVLVVKMRHSRVDSWLRLPVHPHPCLSGPPRRAESLLKCCTLVASSRRPRGVPGAKLTHWPPPGARRLGDGAVRRGAGMHRVTPRLSVVVVGDERNLLQVLVGGLELQGCAARSATHACEALRLILEAPPKVVLLEWRMPAGSGVTLVAYLQQRGISVPTVLVTGAEDTEGWATELGAVALLKQPLDVGELGALVQQLTPAGG